MAGMNQPAASLPSIDDIIADFELLDDWEDRYRYVIELGKTLAPLPDAEHNDANKVRGCASQVWLVFDPTDDGRVVFRGDSDAHIVKGLVALLHALYSGRPATEVLAIDARAELARLDLEDHITPQRSNGLGAMAERIRAHAAGLAGAA